MADKKHVLIIEDDYALSDASKMILEFSGYEVSNAYNGKEALAFLKHTTPDVIILDILMPIMDGRDFLRHFKNEKEIPVLALSNLDARDEVQQILDLGASRYALKSNASPQVLVELVDQMLN